MITSLVIFSNKYFIKFLSLIFHVCDYIDVYECITKSEVDVRCLFQLFATFYFLLILFFLHLLPSSSSSEPEPHLFSFSIGQNTESALKTTVTLLYASKENIKEEISDTLPFMTASKLHLRNLSKRVKDVKSLKKDIEEDTGIWKDFPMHIVWNRINIVEMATLPKAIYRFNEDLNSHATFHRNRKKKILSVHGNTEYPE